ncbi:MAG: hypothetical protein N2110_08645 [Flavobacteriales bacterium]|nr:hypothetical protein [Flavobacteriales bacterium]MCX7769071.1 hypothetical protein [Flavobacteriales bacterium]MDW8410740.1 hypothetical protein [Flavobacteriales bacterium]
MGVPPCGPAAGDPAFGRPLHPKRVGHSVPAGATELLPSVLRTPKIFSLHLRWKPRPSSYTFLQLYLCLT